LIACVGGVAGIISLTRKEQLAALPGVAISITLMPPICTMSFAIANGRWTLVGGAFYLFLINAIIIASASTIIVRLLGFPLLRTITKRQRLMRFNLGWVGIIIFLLPSYFLLMDNIAEKKDHNRIESFVTEMFPEDSLTSTQWEVLSRDSGQVVKIVFQGSVLSTDSIKLLTSKFDSMRIPNTWIQIVQPTINKQVVDHIVKKIDDRVDQQKSPEASIAKTSLFDLKQRMRDVKELQLKKVDGQTLVAELEWRRGKLLTMSRKRKLKEIQEFLHEKLGKEITIIEV
jgi:hypothetical protein